MAGFQPKDPAFEARVRESFGRQRVMAQLGATLEVVRPGQVEVHFPFHERFTQQHGFVHAGIISTVLDSACGYAAFSLMPADAGVLTVEFKVNLLAPAAGERFLARAEVLRPGRTITVCQGSVVAVGRSPGGSKAEREVQVACMQATIMTVLQRQGVAG